MPPFRLEAPERPPIHVRQPKILYTKNSYSDGVKVRRWQEVLENKPYDVDPYCQGKVNYFLSHYHRLGTGEDRNFSTTTNDMLQQVFIKDKMVPGRLMNNYYTYNDNAECLTEYPKEHCPLVCADDFSTTMQLSYQLPHPYIMQRLAFPKAPFMQNRKYRNEDPDFSPHKFYNEGFDDVSCQLREHKAFRWISYNPMTGTYTNAKGIPTE